MLTNLNLLLLTKLLLIFVENFSLIHKQFNIYKMRGNKLKISQFYLLLTLLFIMFSAQLKAQSVKVILGEDKVPLNSYFTITLTVENERLTQYGEFPVIDGFQKRSISSSSSTSMINGQISSSQSIIQNYFPQQKGNFRIPDFEITVNGRAVQVRGKVVSVIDPVDRPQRRSFFDPFESDPFDDFFGRRKEPEFVNVDADAFLGLMVDKDEVYVGEGVNISLALFVSDQNRAPMEFYDLGQQLSAILQKIKPMNTWEENFNIENITREQMNIGGKRYSRYKIYQATLYPLTVKDLEIPSVGLKMVKYNVAKNPSFFGPQRQQDFVTFYTKPKKIKVKNLPPHPLREQVQVGSYFLEENIFQDEFQTGESINYQFKISGEGHIGAISRPKLPSQEDFMIYDPNVTQNIVRSAGRVKGSKMFSYYLVPQEPGTYDFGDIFQWVYFDPKKERYDTLRSSKQILVGGESKKNESIIAKDFNSFYNRLDFADNRLRSRWYAEWMKIGANLAILLMLGLAAFLVFRKP